MEELQERIRRCLTEIDKLGPINMRAIEEFKVLNVEFVQLKEKLDKLLEEKESILKVVQEVEKKRYDKFMLILKDITENFSTISKDLMNGYGTIRLELENNIDSGLIIEASPEGKKVLNLDSMSGGERTLTSLAFLFAIMQHYSAPFYILDEVDAALDKLNTKKIVELEKKYSKENQFIVITHNDTTIQEADQVFGVSMEDGVSKIFGIRMPER
jgi:chromosome segregation protein